MADEQKKETYDSNVVLIGKKPFRNYIMSVLMQLKKSNSVEIKARGQFISRAVDIAEAAKKIKDNGKRIIVKDIQIASNEVENKNKRLVDVSSIVIKLEQKQLI